MKNMTDQLANYAAYHRDRRNIATHLIGVPMIVFGVVTLMARPAIEVAGLPVTPAMVALIAAGIYFLLLDFALGLGLILVIGAMAWVGHGVAAAGTPIWLMVGIGMFVVGWIIQFIGHYYEGRKPAFVDDILGLLIGPLFVLSEVVFMLGGRRTLQASIEARVGPTGLREMRSKTPVAPRSKVV